MTNPITHPIPLTPASLAQRQNDNILILHVCYFCIYCCFYTFVHSCFYFLHRYITQDICIFLLEDMNCSYHILAHVRLLNILRTSIGLQCFLPIKKFERKHAFADDLHYPPPHSNYTRYPGPQTKLERYDFFILFVFLFLHMCTFIFLLFALKHYEPHLYIFLLELNTKSVSN